MNLTVHDPLTVEKEQELAARVAVLHAKAVVEYLNHLPCPYEEKIALLEQIKESHLR